jgi:hypothetical protein
MSEDSPSRHPEMASDSCGAAGPAANDSGAATPADTSADTPPLQAILVDEPLSKGRRSRHRTLLVVACVVVVLSVMFRVRDDRQRVEIRGLPGISMPETCWSRSLFHVKCPGCGLTRSLVYLAHGDWQASWQMHRVGFVMALAILAQFPYCIVGLCYKKDYPLGRRFASLVAWTLIALLMGNWLYDVVASAA